MSFASRLGYFGEATFRRHPSSSLGSGEASPTSLPCGSLTSSPRDYCHSCSPCSFQIRTEKRSQNPCVETVLSLKFGREVPRLTTLLRR